MYFITLSLSNVLQYLLALQPCGPRFSVLLSYLGPGAEFMNVAESGAPAGGGLPEPSVPRVPSAATFSEI